MSVVDDFLKKMKMVSDDDYDDYDEYDDYDDEEDEDEEIISKKKVKTKTRSKADDYDDDDYDDDDDYTGAYSNPTKPAKTDPKPAQQSYAQPSKVVGMRSQGSASEVCMIMPKSFDDANTIADVLLSHKAVVLNLEGIDMAAAQRIIDFASGACYTVGGNLQKISKKIFIVVPQDMNLSGDFDELIGDMVDLNSVNMMK